jgi:hydrogenase expression/formation protein HypD
LKRFLEEIESLTDQIRRVYGEDHKIKIMNFCGTREWTIVRYGIRSILPRMIELVAGPACLMCVTPSYHIEGLIKYSLGEKIIVCTFGDVYRLRSVRPVRGAYSLSEAKVLGADVRIVEGFADAVRDSLRYKRESVFVGIGFETIAPGYARYTLHNKIPNNMSF